MAKILVVEPYFGGSHKYFIQGLKKYVEAEYTMLTLPARKWKMRMQLSAPWFADQIEQFDSKEFDTVLCSTFVDVAVFRSLLNRIDGWCTETRICTYFHENQFAYPVNEGDFCNYQFNAINFTTALASDRIAFNSLYNYRTFINSVASYLKKAADMRLDEHAAAIALKSTILYPGIDPCFLEAGKVKRDSTMPVVCWNHRWEYDKNPVEFFQTLFEINQSGVDFKLIVLGQSFKNYPDIFKQAQQELKNNILHFGYVPSKEEYVRLLGKADIVVSTSLHEFYGIAVLEAVFAGCLPLVPDRLVYPELYPECYLYREGQLKTTLCKLLAEWDSTKRKPVQMDVNKFSWDNLNNTYRKWLVE